MTEVFLRNRGLNLKELRESDSKRELGVQILASCLPFDLPNQIRRFKIPFYNKFRVFK